MTNCERGHQSRWALAVLCLLPVAALAGDDLNLDSIAGVYKDRFKNELVDGTSFTSENILEIVKLSGQKVYFRTHLEFYNGHMCSLYGVATVKNGALLYHASEPIDLRTTEDKPVEEHCDFKIVVGRDKIAFGDADNGCKMTNCGMRGSFDGITFDRKVRKTIRYMTLLKKSEQFSDALDEAGIKH